MVRLWTRAAALLVVASLSVPGVARGEGRAYEGYCENGKPVITKWNPALDEFFEPACDGTMLILRQKPSTITDPNTPPPEPIKPPEDFYTWAFLRLNGKAIKNPYRDVRAFVTKSTGRTLIPLRVVTEAMGGEVEWDQEKWQVTMRLGDKYMIMTIGETDAVANGQAVKVDQPPILWMDRTMVPIRVIAEAFGATVEWIDAASRVDIRLEGVSCPDEYCVAV